MELCLYMLTLVVGILVLWYEEVLDYSAAIQELFSFLGIGTKQKCVKVVNNVGKDKKWLSHPTTESSFRWLHLRWLTNKKIIV